MLRFALRKPAGLLVGVVGIASVLGACGSFHPTAGTPPSPVAKLGGPRASTTTVPLRAKAAVSSTATSAAATSGTSTAATSSAAHTTEPPVTEPPATAPPATAPATAAPPATPVPTTLAPAPPATSPPASLVRVLADCQTPSYEPATIILSCSGGSTVATAIKWTSWGATSATGTAVIRTSLCNPTCAQGSSSGSFPANITLTDVAAAGTSGSLFSTLTASFPGASPSSTPTEVYSIGGIG